MNPDEEPPAGDRALAAIVHREFLQLAALIAAVVLMFLATRELAAAVVAQRAADAESWRERGAQAEAGHDARTAAEAYRHALELERTLPSALALSGALEAAGDAAGAEGVLLEWRGVYPENPELNLRLARIAASRHDVDQALRYYNYVLYSPAAPRDDPARPGIRLELARFLAAHGQNARAASELMVVAERPLDPSLRREVAALLRSVGDPTAAAAQYRAVLRERRDDGASHLGLAEALFDLGNYSDARAEFRRAAALGVTPGEDAQVAELVLSDDPLLPRLSQRERVRRLASNVDYMLERLDRCGAEAASGGTPGAGAELSSMRTELAALAAALKAPRVDPDVLSRGVDLADQTVAAIASRCAETGPRDRALAAMAARHDVAP